MPRDSVSNSAISERKPAEFLSVKQTANRLCISTDAVYEAIDRGELRAYRVGRLLKLDPADVEDFIKPYVPQIDSSEAVAR